MKKEQVFSPEIKKETHCLLHGSMNKFLPEMTEAYNIFNNNGIIVELDLSQEISSNDNNFAKFKGQENLDNYFIEGNFLQKLNKSNLDFCYFVNPNGYMGKGATFELSGATFLNIPVFFLEQPDLDFYKAPKNSVWGPKDLVNYINKYKKLPDRSIESKEWRELIIPRKVVAVGAVVEWQPKQGSEKQVLLVKTHQWGGRFSIVGKKMGNDETPQETLIRGVYKETGLEIESATLLTTFNQIPNSGYFNPFCPNPLFIDFRTLVSNKDVHLDEQAQDFVWIPPQKALNELNLEPNARLTLETYLKTESSNL